MEIVKETFTLNSGTEKVFEIDVEGEASDLERLAEEMKRNIVDAAEKAEKTSSVHINSYDF